MLSTPTTIHEIEAYAKSLLAKDWSAELFAKGIIIPSGKQFKGILKDIGWTFDYDNAKRRFGLCYYTKKQIRLSLPLVQLNLDKPAQIQETTLHEVAHSLSYTIFGREGSGHGPKWKMVAKAIGSNSERCYDHTVSTPMRRYLYECPNCHQGTTRHKKISKNLACGACCKKFNGGQYSNEYILILKEDRFNVI